MMDEGTLLTLLRQTLPDAEITLTDRTGTMDHFNLHVRSQRFSGLSLLDQHRTVYAALSEPMRDGRIHALELKTEILEACR